MKTKIDFKTKPIPFSGKLRKVLRPVIWAGFSVLVVACGGDAFTTPGNTGSVTDPVIDPVTDPVTDPVISTAANIILLASTPTLGSASASEVQLTAQIKDVNNALVEGEVVTFSATDGGLLVSSGTTNAAGLATASLSTAGDPANRTITVTATAGEQSANVDITVTGTTISISGESSVVFNDEIGLTIFLKDSEGNGIPNKTVMVSSANNNTLSANLLMTGASGEVPVTLTGTQGGADVITVSSLGSVAQYSINVSADQFDLTLSDTDLNIGVTHTIILNWQQGGNPVADGQVVNFSATRGSLSTSSAMIANGQASVTILSTNAGPSLITAFVNDGPTTSASIDFIATTPAKLTLQAASATIGPNGQNDAITAVVRDANNNLVKKIPIRFNIVQDNSNGAISNSTDTTDTLGRASTVYTSTAVTTARDGVIIQAEVENRADLLSCDQSELCTTVAITVAQSDLFVRLGTSHLMSALDATRYSKPYNVLVTDSAGNARANVDVKLTLTPSYYLKGQRFLGKDDMNEPKAPWFAVSSATCQSEDSLLGDNDADLNGILDTGEDLNGNGQLDPGNVASVPATVTTDDTGFAVFDIIYGKDFASWVEYELTATTQVAGSEGLDKVEFILPVLLADLASKDITPPGYISPFGSTGIDASGITSGTNAINCSDPN